MKFSWLLVIVTIAIPGATSAQQNALPQSKAPHATVVRSGEIMAAVGQNDTEALADTLLRVVPIEPKYNVAVAVVRQSGTDGHPPTAAFAHDDITEVYQIIEGRGVLVTGGKLYSVKPVTDGKILREIGPSSKGNGIAGGTRTCVGPGDIVVIPPHTPHEFVEISTKRIVYTIIRIDSHRVLALHSHPHSTCDGCRPTKSGNSGDL